MEKASDLINLTAYQRVSKHVYVYVFFILIWSEIALYANTV